MDSSLTHPYPSEPTRVVQAGGSDRDIGLQHGEQVRDVMDRSMPVFFHRFFQRSLEPPKGTSAWERRAFSLAVKAIDPWLLDKLWKQVSLPIKEGLAGLAAATGLDESKLRVSLVLPDVLPVLQTLLMNLSPERRVQVNLPPRMGCSSFVANSPSRFFVGRNLDFPGVGYWERYPVIQVSKPKGKLAHIALTTVGVPLGGISGVNEAQVSVQLHQHYCLDFNLSGRLPYVISEEILREARTAADALKILQRSKVASSWAFVVADGKTREAFIYETQPKASGIRRLSERGGVLTHSNFYRTPECRPREYATTERMTWDNVCRKGRLDENIRKNLYSLTPETCVGFLGEHFDPYWGEEKVFNRTVSQVFNLQSYLLELDTMQLYLAEGNAPVHLGGYRRYDLGALFSGQAGKTEMVLPGYQFKDPKIKASKEKYILSFIAAFDNELEKSYRWAVEALAECFTPEAAYVTALINLRLEGDPQISLDYLDNALSFIDEKKKRLGLSGWPPEYFEISLYRGRVLDLMGKREAAIQTYRRLSEHPGLEDANIRSLAYSAKPYDRKRLNRLVMPFSSYLPFD